MHWSLQVHLPNHLGSRDLKRSQHQYRHPSGRLTFVDVKSSNHGERRQSLCHQATIHREQAR